ncbi:hypothetical protein Tco_0556395 [Tanacetum coccineum]
MRWRGCRGGADVVVVEMVCRGDGSGGGVVMVVAATKVGWRWRRFLKMVFGGGSDGVGLELMGVASTAGGRRGCASVVVGRRWPESGQKMGREEMEDML